MADEPSDVPGLFLGVPVFGTVVRRITRAASFDC